MVSDGNKANVFIGFAKIGDKLHFLRLIAVGKIGQV
jgi:hypothetical protein